MAVISTKVRRWGNSLGIIIPSDAVAKRKLKENQDVSLVILEDSKEVFDETFGSLKGKLKKSGQKMKDELRRELY
jgi:antitoxin component of MazEF toxin-antitoxin module